MVDFSEDKPMWVPTIDDINSSNITNFINFLNNSCNLSITDFNSLSDWSKNYSEKFYEVLWDFAGIIAEKKGTPTLLESNKMPGAKWFPEAKLNFAQNILTKKDNSLAIIFQSENKVYRELSWNELYRSVSKLTKVFLDFGVRPGDRVVGFMPNIPETVISMLAAASIGAVWSSCSPDFGFKGVIDRFSQIEPKILITADGYFYNGKSHNSLYKVEQIIDQLPSIKKVIVVPYLNSDHSLNNIKTSFSWNDCMRSEQSPEIDFISMKFDHPLYIMYSSGTTGIPKCIVHGAGGTLLQHLKEHLLHTDIKLGDRLFYFTTCGWMMWNWLVSSLACGATIVLYDGSPFYPDFNQLWSLVDKAKIKIFGTSAKYLDTCRKENICPQKKNSLSTLQTILSTGSPLSPSSFDYVYEKVKSNVRLSSISGGTDIISCFASGTSTLPVWRGEIQALALGMDVRVFDNEGNSIIGSKGELVCTSPFPSMPIGFWNDPDGSRYKKAYFEKFEGVWTHGDYCEITKHGGMIISGRSDAILNPGGVRIGTAEIYRQVESMEEVEEAICVGQEWHGDIRIILFVRLFSENKLNDDLKNKIRLKIRENTTPRHIPAKIISVKDIPRTISGKITELAVRETIHGRNVSNKDALANPDALDLYKNIKELEN